MNTVKTRYSDEDLKAFENLVNTKLNKAYEQLESLQNQLIEMEESVEDSGGSHYMNDGNFSEHIEFLNGMTNRQRKHINDLEAAMMRIKNKTYGRCVLTGELIDRNRLLAVPTTTKSLLAKTMIASKPKREVKVVEGATPRVYSRIIKKVKPTNDKDAIYIDLPHYEDDDDNELEQDQV